MDPQKLPDEKPANTNTPNPSDAANDISMSEESSAPPGTVVVGGPAAPDTDMRPPAPGQTPPPPAPSADNPDKMAAFMREPDTSVPPAPSGGKKTGLIIGIIAAVLIVFGGAAAAYFAFMVPKPDKILQTALANTFSKDKAKTVAFTGEASVTEQSSSSTFNLGFTGALGENGQMILTANLNFPELTPVTVDVRSTDGDLVYVKLSGLADVIAQLMDVPAIAPYGSLLTSLDNQWYEISPAVLEQLAGSSTPSSTELSDTDRQKLADAYSQNQFMTVKETLADESIAGVNSYHYKVGIDDAKLKSFVSAVEAANIESLGMLNPLLASLKAGTSNSELLSNPVDVWISKDSKMFTQFSYSGQSDQTSFSIKLTLKDYNKDITVEQPEGAKPLTDLLTSFYQATGAGDVPDNLLQ